MKKCKKCNNEYKDDYNYCPKCGKPYNDSEKAVKIPENIGGEFKSTILRIWNILLYVFGGMMIIGSIPTIIEEPITSILCILFGVSLFQIVYRIINEKTEIEESNLKAARVVVPIVLLILIGMFPSSGTQLENQTTKDTDIGVEESVESADNDKVNINNLKSKIESLGITVESKDAYYKMVGAENGMKLYAGDYRIEVYKFDETSKEYIEAKKNQKLKTSISSFDATVKNGYAYIIDDEFPKHDEVLKLLEKLR